MSSPSALTSQQFGKDFICLKNNGRDGACVSGFPLVTIVKHIRLGTSHCTDHGEVIGSAGQLESTTQKLFQTSRVYLLTEWNGALSVKACGC
jgi:hypothetical protein